MKNDPTTKELHEQRAVLWNESISAHQKYIDSATGLFAKQYVEERKCPACGSEDFLHLFDKEGGSYVKCNACSMVFLNPVFKDEALNEFYKTNHTVQAEIVESDMKFYIDLYEQGLDHIDTSIQNRDTASILDIGCSSGIFLDTARERNWKTYGIELNQLESELAKKKKHIVYTDLLENIDLDLKFDAVTMWDVFEHIKDGVFYLEMMKKHLSSNGVIFIQIPSSASLAACILHEKCNMFDGMEHVNLYCHEAVKILVQGCGLKIMNISTVISEIGVINNHLAYESPYTGTVTNKDNIMGLVNEKNIHDNLLGYKYQITLGKE